MAEANDGMAVSLTRLKASVERIDAKRSDEAGVSWNPATHIAIGLWQLGKGRSSVFGLFTESEPDVERIATVVEKALALTSSGLGSFQVLCGSYADLSHLKPELKAAEIQIIAEIEDRLGGTRLALEAADAKGLSEAVRVLWMECHSFLAFSNEMNFCEHVALLGDLDTDAFRFSVEPKTGIVVVRHNHAEDLFLVVERVRCVPAMLESLKRLVEDPG